MKKAAQKLTLHRETLLALSAPVLRSAQGASINYGCTLLPCMYSVAVCTVDDPSIDTDTCPENCNQYD
jgi:hypothetical protein